MRRKSILLFFCNIVIFFLVKAQSNVGIGTPHPDPSAILELHDFAHGFLTPRMSALQRVGIQAPANGLLVYDTTVNCLYYYSSDSGWQSLCHSTAFTDSVYFNCGIGSLSVKTASGIYSSAGLAWLGSGLSTGTGGGPASRGPYFGTYNLDDIRIATGNQSCSFDPRKQKMLISADGNVSIGTYDGSNLPSYPKAKLQLENGHINPNLYNGAPVRLDSGSVALMINAATSIASPVYNIGIWLNAASNNADTGNIGIFSYSTGRSRVFNMGVYGYASGSASNEGVIGGAFANGAAGGRNIGLGAVAKGGTASNTEGVDVVSIADSGSNNLGLMENVNGDHNNSWNIYSVSGSAYNAGGACKVFGAASTNVGYWAEIIDYGTSDTGSSNIGLIGACTVQNTGSQVGVLGYVSAVAGASYNYAVQGIQPGTYSGPDSLLQGSPSAINFAGYFEGDVFAAGTYYYSDPKLKRGISAYDGAMDKLNKLKVVQYDFKCDEFPDLKLPAGRQVGILSTDLKEVFPQLVKEAMHTDYSGRKNNLRFQAVNYPALIPLLVKAVQELDRKTADQSVLMDRLGAQEQKIKALSEEIDALKVLLKVGKE